MEYHRALDNGSEKGVVGDAIRDLELIRDAGFTWVKQHVGWRDIEGITKGSYDWYFTDRIVADAERLDLNVIFRLDRQPVWTLPPEESRTGPIENPQDFGHFCHAIADRYRGRVCAYQVWNEPNLAREWQGDGVDTQLVDPATLKREWQSKSMDFHSALLMQAAWLQTHQDE